ncbi:MAG: ATP-binding cassette domain-containing protein [Vallitaleaceae bacterium]|jgi:ABC-type lipoprotein export system ATPase subunit|nr:ATP-binding cassette domain-containing protein [Vallitaleaceae bacterium]
MDNPQYMIECDNLVKIYKTKDIEVVALQGLDLLVERGEFTAIIGKSGSGKSTLLNIIAGLDRPSAGKVSVAGKDLLKFTDHQLKEYNRATIGFVWQNNARNLIPYLTALQNVMVPLMITKKKERKKRALELLAMVGLTERRKSRLGELSGGEQQRVAIAIALANEPDMLLADEPTGSVDTKTAYMLLELLERLNRELGLTIVVVTHDEKVSKMVKRVVAINDGMIGSERFKIDDSEEGLQSMEAFIGDEKTHDEYVILDRKGRMRLPDEMLAHMDLRGGEKLLVHESEDGFIIKPYVEK